MPNGSNPKGVVYYRTMEVIGRRCGTCAHFDSACNTCEVVSGEILADMLCDLYTLRRPDLGGQRLGLPATVSRIPQLDIPQITRMSRDPVVVEGYLAQNDQGDFVVKESPEALRFWDQVAAQLDVDPADVFFDPDGGPRPVADLVFIPETGQIHVSKAAPAPDGDVVEWGFEVTKADEERRYTFGPLYLPGQLDAHGEFVTGPDLQKAAWDYVRKSIAAGSNTIYRQHTDEAAGEWVDIVTWPYEQTVKTTVPGGGEAIRTFPAGTVYQGVVWNEATWPDVKAGKIRGMSMGGRAKRRVLHNPALNPRQSY